MTQSTRSRPKSAKDKIVESVVRWATRDDVQAISLDERTFKLLGETEINGVRLYSTAEGLYPSTPILFICRRYLEE